MLLVGACGIVGCASAPSLPRAVTLVEGKRTTVSYSQPSVHLTLTLQNESSGTRSEVYSSGNADPGLKVVSDQTMQALLDVFTAKGLFDHAGGSLDQAQDVLVIDSDGQRWTCTRRKFGSSPADQALVEAKAYFLQVYNSNLSLHSATAPDFRDERSRARDEAAAAKKKLEARQGATGNPGSGNPGNGNRGNGQ